MGKLLLITGDLAAGKSRFASVLSERYNASMFFKDSIKEVLADTVGFSTPEESRNLSVAAVELMFLICSEFGRLGKNLILEANFRGAELEKLQQIASDNRYDVLTLVIRGDTAILHRRFLNRMRQENRHPAHLTAGLDEFNRFKAYIEQARAEKIPGHALYIPADDFSYQTDAELLGKIDAFMKD